MGARGLELCGIEIEALSVGGLETCIELPRQRLAFDIGRCPDSAVARSTVLFTHAHMDHLGGVAYHCATRSLRRLPPPTYLIGRENEQAFRELFAAWRGLDRSDLEHELVVLEPGEQHELPCKWLARPFRALHRVPCQGYGLWSRKHKLAPDFAGLPNDELRRLRASGVELTRTVETAELAFCGDTLIEVVEREPVVRRARVLVLECTFLDELVSVEECRGKGHIHLDEIAERAELFENEAILLTHFSARYSAARIRALLERKLPPQLLARVTPLLNAHS